MKPTLLIIEDCPALKARLAEGLQERFRILGKVGSASEGISALKAHRPDVVLVDLTLRDFSGLEWLEKCHEMKNPPKVVLLSGLSQERYLWQAYRFGVSDIVLKPAKMNKIEGALLRAAS